MKVTVSCRICGRTPRPGLRWWCRSDWAEEEGLRDDGDLCLRCALLSVAAAFNLLARRTRAERAAKELNA